jgi:hypothetical protein
MMKSYLRLVPLLLVLVFGAVASSSAMAQRGGHGGGYGHGGGHGYGWGGLGLGIALGSLYGLGYYSNPYYPAPAYAYPAPAYTYPAPPAAYVEQGVPKVTPAQPQGDWYYCADSKSYYPYVRECPGGWQRVPSTPPR